jgi:hypothetical protein
MILLHFPFAGYLCNISPDEFENLFLNILPKQFQEKNFLITIKSLLMMQHKLTESGPTLRASTSHPIYEHHRVIYSKIYLFNSISYYSTRMIVYSSYKKWAN